MSDSCAEERNPHTVKSIDLLLHLGASDEGVVCEHTFDIILSKETGLLHCPEMTLTSSTHFSGLPWPFSPERHPTVPLTAVPAPFPHTAVSQLT